MKSFKRGMEWPNEGYIQTAIAAHFEALGFETISAGHIDHCCIHAGTGEKWIIEAKGDTAQPGLDFNTGVGQLLRRMIDASAKYALAVPDLPKFRKHLSAISPYVRDRLQLYWLIVDKAGRVATVAPTDKLTL